MLGELMKCFDDYIMWLLGQQMSSLLNAYNRFSTIFIIYLRLSCIAAQFIEL